MLDEDEVPRDATGRPLVSGFFVIRKDEKSDRTITNAIPANSQEKGLGHAREILAHASCFGDMIIGEEERIRGSGRDLPDCYHSAKVPPLRVERNAVGPWLPREEVRGMKAYAELLERRKAKGLFDEPEYVVAAWKSLPMGDLNAVDFMCVAHVNVLRHAGAALSLVRYAAPLPDPEDGVLESIVVDDYGIVAVVPRDLPSDSPAADTERMAIADAIYASEGVPPKESKSFNNERIFEVCGATIDGDVGSVRATINLLLRTSLLSLRLLSDGRATPGSWDAVVGLWGYAFLYNRSAYSVFCHVYRETRDVSPGQVFAPSLTGRAELEIALAFAPLLASDVRAPVAETVWATDASDDKAAIVKSSLPRRAVETLWRLRCRKGNQVEMKSMAETMQERLLAGGGRYCAGSVGATERATSMRGAGGRGAEQLVHLSRSSSRLGVRHVL